MKHKKQWEFLKNKFEANRLSHAYLFSGPKNIGKKEFVIEFAKLLNCLSEDKPCEKCVNCLMIEKGIFPDLKVLHRSHEKDYKFGDGGEIKINQIREAQNFLSYKSYHGGFKVLIIDDAEDMNAEAQNCFLKTLEEPKGQTMLVLITSKPDLLLPTIISRCQRVRFMGKPAEKDGKEKEILDNFIPVIDANFAEKFKYAKALDFEKQNPVEILEVIQKYFRNLLLKEVGVENSAIAPSKKYSVNDLKNILELIDSVSNKLIFTNANPKLAMEILLMEI